MIKQLLHDEKVVSVSGTILIHLLLLLIFFLVQIEFKPLIEEFTEVTLAGGFQAPPLERLPQPPPIPGEETPTLNDQFRQNLPEEIELPERRQLQLNEEELIEKLQPEIEKIVTPGNVVKKQPTETRPLPRTTEQSPTFARKEKQMEKGLFRKQLDEKLLEGTQRVNINIDRQFEIDWEGEIKREIYQQRLPEFPPDVQREATIKIEFTVLPNGLVGSAIIVQKGDTRLENLTLESFKTWRFNPLPEYVEQVPQKGIITFHFKLK
ncbi:MAG: hypothetical protein Kow0042_12200 [Calditrichia bacterium]